MTLRSTDMQIIIQKTSEVVRNQQQQNSRARLQQQQIAQQSQNRIDVESRQVNSLLKTHESRIREEKEKNHKKRHNRGNDRKTNEASSGKSETSSIIDIKI